jgi:ATP-dependent helicase HrpB
VTPFDLPDLPVTEVVDDLRAALAGPQRAVLVAPPGAGKTTVIPLALLDEPWLQGNRIVMLEPRRLATRAAARRMSSLLGDQVGGTVGYQTRDERHIGPTTRIEVVTEGILTRRLQSDPELPGVGLVIFDEVHERNLPADLGLALTLDVASTLRPDLRILAMSATADTESLRQVLEGPDGPAPVLVSEGRLHPVDIRWMPRGQREWLEPAVVAAVRRGLAEEPGDVLVFLPGIGEIMRVQRELRAVLPDHVDVRPLAGALSLADQDAALAPSPAGRRRVVLATDIAETSLTVDGVRVVVDSGLARAPRFDARTGMSRLSTVSTSRSSAEQRTGRAGRVEPGVCYRLWSKLEHGTRPAHRPAEIKEVDLAGFALELAAWGGRAEDLRFLDPPPPKTLAAGRELLSSLGALDDTGTLTEVGRGMLALPVHPRLARMIAVDRSPLACVLAALVDERDVLRGRLDELPADLALRVGVICGTDGHERADRRSVDRLRSRAAEIAQRARIGFHTDLVDPDRSGAVLLLAFPDRLAARRRPGQFQMRTGAGAWLPDADPLAHEAFVVAVDLDGKRDRARIRLAAGVDGDAVAAQFGDELDETRTVIWDEDRDDVVEQVERRLGSIRLGSITRPAQSGTDATRVLLQRVRSTGLAQLNWTGAAVRLRERVEFLHRSIGEPWPDWRVETLSATLDHWLAPFLLGARSRHDVERVDLVMVLRSQLPWEVGSTLDDHAPEELELPSGRSVRIDYSGEAPAASVRVQDLFGLSEHPRAAGLAIVLHLLSPADRPVQVTADLPGFWAGSWAQVRKEMAGRYPKHQWPEHPETAQPKRLKDR